MTDDPMFDIKNFKLSKFRAWDLIAVIKDDMEQRGITRALLSRQTHILPKRLTRVLNGGVPQAWELRKIVIACASARR